MLKFENTTTKDGGDARTTTCARTCDTCCSAPSAVYCHADMAYLCGACDADIHSANPLSRRHHRVPIQPIPGTLYGPLAAVNRSELIITREGYESGDDEDEDEAASWLLLNPIKYGDDEIGQPPLFGGDVDEYLELDEYNSCQNNQQQHYSSVPHSSYGGDSIVPIQYQKERNIHCFQLGLEAGYSYPASMSQSVSISSMDVGVVPESTLSEASVSHTMRAPKGTIDLFSSPPIQVPTQLSPMDREARVLRYREKKKNRKFEKTIRYASRKAYAETRPRIKGRFAKRRDAQIEVDQMFSSTSLMAETAYGVVPTF